jgi:hypothetical protein
MLPDCRYNMVLQVVTLFYIIECNIRAMINGAQTIFYGCTEEISKELRRSEIGSHFLVEYPNLPTLREMYLLYTKSALYDGNEIVIILPFYDIALNILEEMYEGHQKHEGHNRKFTLLSELSEISAPGIPY